MSKSRILKPEFFTDSSVVRCSPLARLLFAGSWVFADDNGIVPDDMLQLKMQVLPGDNVDGEALRGELVGAGLWVPYEADGKRWLLVRGFCKHQTLDRPTAVYPLPDSATLASLGYSVREHTHSRHGRPYTAHMICNGCTTDVRRTDAERTSDVRLEGKGIEGNRTEVNGYIARDGPYDPALVVSSGLIAEVLMAWNSLGAPIEPVKDLGASRVDALAACWRDGFFREHWVEAMRRVAASRFCHGHGDRGWVATIGWFLKPVTVREIMEKKYDDREPSAKQSGRTSEMNDPDKWKNFVGA